MNTRPTNDPESLLADLPVLRRLARALLDDVHAADDLAHDAWMAAWRADAPTSPAARAPWLATVVRNLAHNRRRGERRRGAHERAAGERTLAQATPVTSPAEIARREEARRLVVQAVLALPESQREVVLLRFWDGLEPQQIARRLDVPAATVRTRCKRGLERVRAQLDTRLGAREGWAALLLPGAVLRPALAARALLLLPALGAAGVVCAVLFVLAPWEQADVAPAIARAPHGTDTPRAQVAPTAVDAEPATATRLVPPEIARADDAPPARSGPTYATDDLAHDLHGLVLDPDGRPAPGATVSARPALGELPRTLALHDARVPPEPVTSDAQGRFTFAGLASGAWDLDATLGELGAHASVLADEARLVLVELAAPRELLGIDVRVVDTAGEGVADALVSIFGWDRSGARPGLDGTPPLTRRTNAKGIAHASLGDDGRLLIVARSDDGRIGMATRFLKKWDDTAGAIVVVDAPGRVAGRFVPRADVVPGELRVRVVARTSHTAFVSSAGVALDAEVSGLAFSLDGLPAGEYSLVVDDTGGSRLDLPPLSLRSGPVPSSFTPLTFEVLAGATTELELPLLAGGAISGSVRDDRGKPVERARVLVLPVPENVNLAESQRVEGTLVWRLGGLPGGEQHPAVFRRTTTDAEGRYAVLGLPAANYRIEIEADGLCFDRREGLPLADGERVELEHVLEPDGVLSVGVPGHVLLGLRRDATQPPVAVVGADGPVVTLPGLRPGTYELVRYVGFENTPVSIGPVDIAAGRTTFVDLRELLTSGAVLSGRIELPGVDLEHATAHLFVDGHVEADGRFAIALPDPVRVVFGGPTFSVRKGRSRWSTSVREDLRGLARWYGTFALGDEALDVDTVAGAELRLGMINATSPDGRSVHFDGTLLADADGRVHWSGLPVGVATLVATLPDGLVVTRTVDVPSPDVVRLERIPTGRVSIRAFRPDGTPAVGLVVYVTTSRGEETLGTQAAVTDVRGIARRDAVPVGHVRAATHLVVRRNSIAEADLAEDGDVQLVLRLRDF